MGSSASRLLADLTVPLAICASTNAFTFLVHAAPNKSDKYYDTTGAITYLISTLVSYYLNLPRSSQSVRSMFATGALCAWCSRLGIFLFRRISRDGHDRRMNKIKQSVVSFAGAWTMQVIWIFTVALPVYMLHRYGGSSGSGGDADENGAHAEAGAPASQPFGWLDAAGAALWVVGFLIEATADSQKKAFAEAGLRETKGFITTGLWSMSRHPNYVGEIMLWTGMALAAYSGIKDSEECPAPLAVFASPAFTFLLLRFVSGVPLLERRAHKKWGSEARFQEYIRNVPVLFPTLASLGNLFKRSS